jgi:Protein of unknown function (DUF3467)
MTKEAEFSCALEANKMAKTKPPATPVSRPAPQTFRQSDKFRIIYANGFTFKPSTTDFGVTFMTQIVIPHDLPDGGNVITNIQEIAVMMSLPSAKAFSENIAKLIAEIEKQIGTIRTAKGAILTEEQVSGVGAGLKGATLEG